MKAMNFFELNAALKLFRTFFSLENVCNLSLFSLIAIRGGIHLRKHQFSRDDMRLALLFESKLNAKFPNSVTFIYN